MQTNHWGVHLAYTMPAIGLLSFVARPLICRTDVLKMSLISAAAVAYSTRLDVVSFYSSSSSSDAEDHQPSGPSHVVEACASVAAQTVLTLLWSMFCLRWSTPCLSFNHDERSYRLIRWAPIAALAAAAAAVAVALGPDAPSRSHAGTTAAAALLRWSWPAAAVLWYGAGNLFVRRMASSAVAIAVPALYLCWADGREDRDTGGGGPGAFAPQHMTAGHARLFYAVVSTLVVLAANGCDKATGMAEAYTSEFPRQFAYGPGYVAQLLRAFVTAECSLAADVVQDVRQCFRVLNAESTTFATAVLLFQCGTRLDMVIVYAFGRITDEMFDSDVDPAKKQRDLKMCYDYINEIFANRKTRFHVKRTPEAVNIDWAKYEARLNDSEIASFRALARIAYYLPPAMFYDLLDAYRWDISGEICKTEKDLMTYTHHIAGITALTVCIIMYRDYNDRYFEIVEKGKNGLIIGKAYDMGQAIQFVNIARDIVTDSVQLGRCYIPLEYMDDEKNDARALCQEKNPRSLDDSKLKRYANKMISLTEKFQLESEGFFKSLPAESRALILALTDIYRGYIPAIQSSPTYPTNAKLSRWNMIKIGLYSMYIKSLHYGI